MAITSITPVLNVRELPASFAWFEALGWRRGFAWNAGGTIARAADRDEHGEADFGSLCAGEATIFLCRDGQGSRGSVLPRHPGDDRTDGVWMSWWLDSVESLDELFATAVALGYTITMPPTDEPWGVREFHLRHLDGHMFRVSASLSDE